MANQEMQNRLNTGVSGLDEILNGGLPRNRLYLLEGEPGTGKTTIGLQFLLQGVREGEKCVYITLSESEDEIAAVAGSHGWDLTGLVIHDLTVSGDSLQDDSHYTVFHPAEVELDATTQAVLRQVDELKPTRVVIDSLSEMRMLARDGLRFRRQIVALKQYFIGRHCTVILLNDRTTDMADRQLESIAHGVFRLSYNPPEYGKQRHTLRVVKVRGVNFQSGAHDFNIETGGVVVFPRLAAPLEPAPLVQGEIKSDIENLELLLGGLDYGTTTIFTGPAGIGKTTLAATYAYTAARNGEHAAIYMFDESLGTLYKRMSALGMDLEPFVANGLLSIRYINLAELTPGQLSHLIREEVESNGVKVVVIDSINGYLAATSQQEFLTMQFHELVSYLNRKGLVSILIVGQMGLIGPMKTPIDMSYLADTVVLMRYFEAEGSVRQAISVLKKRSGRHERSIREFTIAPGGIQVGGPLTDFQGVFSGIPTYHGSREKLMDKPDEQAR
jgi:circadian clock protein KaiC